MLLDPALSDQIKLVAGRLFDSQTARFLENQEIIVSTTTRCVVDVRPASSSPADAGYSEVIDLSHLTVLPGLVDAHVHLFLHAYNETSWDDQVTKESLAERTIRATVHARRTLMTGFTTVRDLGTEGAGDADIALRKCVSGPNPIIVGPRYFCANRAIVATGAYGPRSGLYLNQDGVEGIVGAEVADGHDGCVRAVRRQIGAGADWIKIYADYRTRLRMAPVTSRLPAQSQPTFHSSELSAMINTAHSMGVKVAIHASTPKGVEPALNLGVDSIEHGFQLYKSPQLFNSLAKSSSIWVPTLSVLYKSSQWDPSRADLWRDASLSFQHALKVGMTNIACGGDTGAFAHGENALELKLMVQLGAPVTTVLRWATLSGWECVRPLNWEELPGPNPSEEQLAQLGDNEMWFGCIKPGFSADLVGVEGDLEDDFENTIDRVRFVMKMGKVYKRNGIEIR